MRAPRRGKREDSGSPKSEVRGAKSEVEKWAFVALGANLGDAQGNILRGFRELQHLSDQPILRSSLWETAPVDCPPGSPLFINAVAGLLPRAEETPKSLLANLQAIEKGFGRQPKKLPNESRPLDLDLIAFCGEIRNMPELILPHPRAHMRRFVLQPLSEITPNLVLPGESETVSQLLAALPPDETMRRIDG